MEAMIHIGADRGAVKAVESAIIKIVQLEPQRSGFFNRLIDAYLRVKLASVFSKGMEVKYTTISGSAFQNHEARAVPKLRGRSIWVRSRRAIS